MEVDCEGCAGCCLDWRPLVTDDTDPADSDRADSDRADPDEEVPDQAALDHERRGPYRPLDDTYNLAPVTSDEVRSFLDVGYAPALTPRLFRTDDGPHVTVGGVELAAVGDRPAFLVGLRKVRKPVAPFDADPAWLPTCAFLDPGTLQCRIHDTDLYPDTCATYPGSNLELGIETECERVERVHGGERLLDADPPEDATPRFGPGAIGSRVFAHPDPGRIADAVERLADGEPTREDRAEFVAVAAASRPGTVAVDEERYERAKTRALDADSWVEGALAEWTDRAADAGGTPGDRDGSRPDPASARDVEDAHGVEDARGAPETPDWR